MSSVLCNVSTIKLTDKQHCDFQVKYMLDTELPHILRIDQAGAVMVPGEAQVPYPGPREFARVKLENAGIVFFCFTHETSCTIYAMLYV